MMISKRASSIKQMAYAKRIFGAKGQSKKDIALDCGYSPNTANSVSSHIESKPGFNNAMSALALESNNLALSVLHEFKSRGLTDFSNKELISALNAIGSAWAKFNPKDKDSKPVNENNRLRTVVLQNIENQTFTTTKDTTVIENPPVIEVALDNEELDF